MYANNPRKRDNWNHHRRIVVFRCEEGYVLSGPSSSVCLHGEWSPWPMCIDHKYNVMLIHKVQHELLSLLPSDYSLRVKNKSGMKYLEILQPRPKSLLKRVFRKNSYVFPDVAMCETRTDYRQEGLNVVNVTNIGRILRRDDVVRLNHGQWITAVCKSGALMEEPGTFQCWDGKLELPVCHGGHGLRQGGPGLRQGGHGLRQGGHGLRQGGSGGRQIELGRRQTMCRVDLNSTIMHGFANEKAYNFTGTIYLRHDEIMVFTCLGFATMTGPSVGRCENGKITLPVCHDMCLLELDPAVKKADFTEQPYYRYKLKNGFEHIYVEHGHGININCLGRTTRIGPEISQCDDGEIKPGITCNNWCKYPKLRDYIAQAYDLLYNEQYPWVSLADGGYAHHLWQVEINCTLGYRYVDGNDTLLCDDGEWEGKIGRCVPLNIPKLRRSASYHDQMYPLLIPSHA